MHDAHMLLPVHLRALVPAVPGRVALLSPSFSE